MRRARRQRLCRKNWQACRSGQTDGRRRVTLCDRAAHAPRSSFDLSLHVFVTTENRRCDDSPLMTTSWQIDTGKHRVTARFDAPAEGNDCVLVLAHGAGGHMTDAGMAALASLYVRGGFGVVRFNFPYREAGGRRPDPMPVLQQCFRDVVASARERLRASHRGRHRARRSSRLPMAAHRRRKRRLRDRRRRGRHA